MRYINALPLPLPLPLREFYFVFPGLFYCYSRAMNIYALVSTHGFRYGSYKGALQPTTCLNTKTNYYSNVWRNESGVIVSEFPKKLGVGSSIQL